MKCALIILNVLVYASLAQSKWCFQNITTEFEVTKAATRRKEITSWMGNSWKFETYTIVEQIPKTKIKRVCCEGYIPGENGSACEPTCPGGCPELARCAKPDTCECQSGYQLTDGLCRLKCENCEYGQCKDDGICECNPMYVRIENECKPVCSQTCTNGFCSAPDRCECNPGYQGNPLTGACEPSCKQSCGGNAYCSAPDICSCKYGFFGDSSDICQPWCKAECKNGQCVGPNNCACHQGYTKVDGLCIPDCNLGCKSGDCLDGGICRCWPGLVYNNSTGSCEDSILEVSGSVTQTSLIDQTATTPFCLNDCGNGSCIDGVCHCQKGFVIADRLCSSFCLKCDEGDCVAEAVCQQLLENKDISSTESASSSTSIPELHANCDKNCWGGICLNGICQCTDGLILTDENDCVMPCEATCKNGICNQGRICKCNAGYEKKNGSECVQMAQCDRKCVNGFCIAPNRCECHEGYMPHMNPLLSNICRPTCNSMDGEEGCLNGTCIAVNKCQCLDGFKHKPGNRFECVLHMEQNDSTNGGFWILYLFVGLLILLIMCLLGFYVLRTMHRDTYNVGKLEAVLFKKARDNQIVCDI